MPDTVGASVTLTGKDYYAWRQWQDDKEEQDKHRGEWWLSVQGRELIERTWGPEAYNDGNCVRPLYDRVRELEDEQHEFAKERENFVVQMNEKEILLNDLAQLVRERDNAVDDLRATDAIVLNTKIEFNAISKRLDTAIAALERVCEESGARKDESPHDFIRRLKAERDGLQEAAASKQPHSFAIMNWACGHTAASSCLECYKEVCIRLDTVNRELKSFQKEKENEISYKTPLPDPQLTIEKDEALMKCVHSYMVLSSKYLTLADKYAQLVDKYILKRREKEYEAEKA